MNSSTLISEKNGANLQLVQPKPLPLYIRASELLTREIAAGHWQKGDRLPTEAELAKLLGMAVGTVRKALAELAARGLLERRQGSGTYVRGASRQRSIYEFFRLERISGGGLPTARLLDFRQMAHPDDLSAFGPANGQASAGQSYRLRRLRLLDGKPVALEQIWFDARHKAGLKAADLSEALYLFYKEQLGFWISRVEDQISVAPAPPWAPKDFALPPGQACGLIERKAWSGGNRIEEFSRTWFDPQAARYTARWQ
jgi:DNA-binding GntR family transcriptional regulator